MPIRLGSIPITDIRLGSTAIQQVRLGSQLVWSRAAGIRDDFLTEGSLFASPNWVDQGPSAAPYGAFVENGTVRVYLPDSLLASPVLVSQAGFAAAKTPKDDGYLEVGIATAGDPDPVLYTDVFRRMSNGAFTHGVGMRFIASTVRIVRKVGGTDTVQAPAGSYVPGDKMRLVQQGNLHTVLRNGTDVGAWNDDSNTAAKGVGYRSIGLRVNADRPSFFFLFGPRRFSAAPDYIEAG